MTDNEQFTNDAIRKLKQKQFDSSEHMSQLETELMSKYRSVDSLSFAARHKVLLVWICVMLVGSSAIAAGAKLFSKQRLYDIKLTLDSEIISSSRILVNEGQEASIFITGGDVDFKIQVLEDGSVIYHGPEDVDVDVKVKEIDVNEDNS